MQFDVKADVSAAMRKLKNSQKAVTAAAVSALNKTISEVKTQTVRDMQQEMGEAMGLNTTGFRKALQEAKANRNKLAASITATGKPLPLIMFGARQAASGTSAKAWNKRKLYKGTFIATMKSGHKGVFKRSSKKRLPVKELYGPSIPQTMASGAIDSAMKRHAGNAWPKNWKHELEFYLGRQQ